MCRNNITTEIIIITCLHTYIPGLIFHNPLNYRSQFDYALPNMSHNKGHMVNKYV